MTTGSSAVRGNDAINDGAGGDDLLEGGAGDDIVQDFGSGSDILRGGEGNDDLYLFRAPGTSWTSVTLDGGDGADSVGISTATAGTATVDLGAGDDRLILYAVAGSVRASLGSGRDTIDFWGTPGASTGFVALADFQAGADGDTLKWESSLVFVLSGWTRGSNPFDGGYARLLQSGADTLLQLSFNADGQFVTVLRFENALAAAFTADNFEGWAPSRVHGGAAADQLHGTASSDFLFGEGGNDVLLSPGAAATTSALGGAGNDLLYFGAALSAGDVADGGDGRDALVLQGNVTAVLSETNLVGIESISLQTGANAEYGDTADNRYDYDLTTADGNVAAGQQLIVNAQSLRVGEDFAFDGSAESDGTLPDLRRPRRRHPDRRRRQRHLLLRGPALGTRRQGRRRRRARFPGDQRGRRSDPHRVRRRCLHQHRVRSRSTTSSPPIRPRSRATRSSSHNGNVAPATTLIVNGASIGDPSQFVSIDGSAVHDGHLRMFGGAGNDTLIGGDGADTLIGGGGADDLTGGAGADVFRYDAMTDSTAGAADEIIDFQSGTDKIDLSRLDANTNAAGDQAFTWIGGSAFHGVAGELRAFDVGSTRWIEGDTDGDGDGDFAFAFQTITPLDQSDFLL